MPTSEYIQRTEKYMRRRKMQLTKEQEFAIRKIYERAYVQAIDKYMADIRAGKNGATQIAREAYVNQIYKEAKETIESYGMQISATISKAQVDMMLHQYQYEGTQLYKDIMQNANVANKQIVEQLMKGDFYQDGKSLSDRLWEATNQAGDKIDRAIASCIAQGMGAADMSKVLKEFGKDGHLTWSRNKIREKLGDGYARKYGTGGLDYEALRLARTTLTHQAQLIQKNNHRVNPYSTSVKWHSEHQANRTCQMCIDRDGEVYTNKEAPLDHPNGLCHLESVFTINGQEATPEQMGEDLGKWIRGEKNSGAMDKLYKDIPVDQRYMKPAKPTVPTVPKVAKGPKSVHGIDDDMMQREYSDTFFKLFSGGKDKKYGVEAGEVLIEKYPQHLKDGLYIASRNIKKITNVSGKGAYYMGGNSRELNLSVKSILKDAKTYNLGKYETFFHENGHAVDDILGRLTKRGTLSATKSYVNALISDYENIVETLCSKDWKGDRLGIKKFAMFYDLDEIGDLLQKEMITRFPADKEDKTHGIQDIIGGLAGPRIHKKMSWGHKESYWNRDNRDLEAASEAWAHIFASYSDDETLELMKQYFPQAMAECDKIMAEALDDYVKLKKNKK